MKIYIKTVFIFGFILPSFAQITFNGCHNLFENQDYIFSQVSIDDTGRNVYTTTPVDGAQTCGGLGICEFTISWNNSNGQWEFIADDGNGDFGSPFLIYSNTSASSPNPPGLLLGTWVENDLVTEGGCGGDLSTSNTSFTGDVQNTPLEIEENQLEKMVSIYPNPVDNVINVKTNLQIEAIKIYDVSGKIILNKNDNLKSINTSGLFGGLYFLKIKIADKFITKKISIL